MPIHNNSPDYVGTILTLKGMVEKETEASIAINPNTGKVGFKDGEQTKKDLAEVINLVNEAVSHVDQGQLSLLNIKLDSIKSFLEKKADTLEGSERKEYFGEVHNQTDVFGVKTALNKLNRSISSIGQQYFRSNR